MRWHRLPIFEMPLAIVSLLFYRLMRLLLRTLYQNYFRLRRSLAVRWRVTGARTLRNPLALPVIMTTGPRWNTHAITATVGPLRVTETLEIYTQLAHKSSAAWTIVVYSFPDHRTITTLNSLDDTGETAWQMLPLSPSDYTLILRYYRWCATVELPAVRVDGREEVPATRIPSETNDFLHELAPQAGIFYLWLHFYVFVLLRYRNRLPEAFVRAEFLPVGNPETRFYYGALQQGEAITARFDPRIWETHDIYLTTYNRRSFPSFWYQLQEREDTTPIVAEDGFYLFRVHRTSSHFASLDDDQTTIEVHPAATL